MAAEYEPLWRLRTVMKRIRITEHPLEINLLFTVRTRLLLTNYTPATDAKFVESKPVLD